MGEDIKSIEENGGGRNEVVGFLNKFCVIILCGLQLLTSGSNLAYALPPDEPVSLLDLDPSLTPEEIQEYDAKLSGLWNQQGFREELELYTDIGFLIEQLRIEMNKRWVDFHASLSSRQDGKHLSEEAILQEFVEQKIDKGLIVYENPAIGRAELNSIDKKRFARIIHHSSSRTFIVSAKGNIDPTSLHSRQYISTQHLIPERAVTKLDLSVVCLDPREEVKKETYSKWVYENFIQNSPHIQNFERPARWGKDHWSAVKNAYWVTPKAADFKNAVFTTTLQIGVVASFIGIAWLFFGEKPTLETALIKLGWTASYAFLNGIVFKTLNRIINQGGQFRRFMGSNSRSMLYRMVLFGLYSESQGGWSNEKWMTETKNAAGLTAAGTVMKDAAYEGYRLADESGQYRHKKTKFFGMSITLQAWKEQMAYLSTFGPQRLKDFKWKSDGMSYFANTVYYAAPVLQKTFFYRRQKAALNALRKYVGQESPESILSGDLTAEQFADLREKNGPANTKVLELLKLETEAFQKDNRVTEWFSKPWYYIQEKLEANYPLVARKLAWMEPVLEFVSNKRLEQNGLHYALEREWHLNSDAIRRARANLSSGDKIRAIWHEPGTAALYSYNQLVQTLKMVSLDWLMDLENRVHPDRAGSNEKLKNLLKVEKYWALHEGYFHPLTTPVMDGATAKPLTITGRLKNFISNTTHYLGDTFMRVPAAVREEQGLWQAFWSPYPKLLSDWYQVLEGETLRSRIKIHEQFPQVYAKPNPNFYSSLISKKISEEAPPPTGLPEFNQLSTKEKIVTWHKISPCAKYVKI